MRSRETRHLYGDDIEAANDCESTEFKRYERAVAAIVVKLKTATVRQINERIERECRRENVINRPRWLFCALSSLQSGGVLWEDKKHCQFSIFRAGVEPTRRIIARVEIKGRYSKEQTIFGLI